MTTMVEALGMLMFTNTTTLIPAFNQTIHKTTHLGLSRRNHAHFTLSATSSLIETIPWGCENDSIENSSSLQKWLSQSGLPSQKMSIDKVDVGERGLVALNNIRKGEKLLFVPPQLVITPDSVTLSFFFSLFRKFNSKTIKFIHNCLVSGIQIYLVGFPYLSFSLYTCQTVWKTLWKQLMKSL